MNEALGDLTLRHHRGERRPPPFNLPHPPILPFQDRKLSKCATGGALQRSGERICIKQARPVPASTSKIRLCRLLPYTRGV